MARTLESRQTAITAPAVNNEGLDPVSSAVSNTSNAQEVLRISGLNNERMLEPTGKYIRAPGEKVFQQGNLSIVLGRDRPGARNTGYGGRGHTGASTMDMVAGRQCSPIDSTLNYDPNMEQDAARLYISQKTDIDTNFNTPGNSIAKSAVGLKADAVRIIGRESIMLVTRTEDTNSRGGTAGHGGIQLIANNNASSLQPIVKGSNLVNALQDIDERIKELSTQLLNHIIDQNQFNLKVMNHTHFPAAAVFPPPLPSIPVVMAPSNSLIAGGIQSTLNTCEAVLENLKMRVNLELCEIKYLSGAGSSAINSKYNKVN